MLVLADTNILLRRVHLKHPQHKLTRIALDRLRSNGDELCVTTQNLIECWAVCTRPLENNGLGLSTATTGRILARIESSIIRLGDDRDSLYEEWRKLVIEYRVSGKKSHDARLVAAMRIHGVSHVLTYNVGDFRRFAGIVVLRPGESA